MTGNQKKNRNPLIRKEQKTWQILMLPALIVIFSGCHKLTPIYVISDKATVLNTSDTISFREYKSIVRQSDTTYFIGSNLYWFSADEHYGNTPPSTIRVSSSAQSSARSYISRSINTNETRIRDTRESRWIFTLLYWLGAITVVLISAFGYLMIDAEGIKKNKLLAIIKMLLMQVPLVVFFIYVDFPPVFLFLWFFGILIFSLLLVAPLPSDIIKITVLFIAMLFILSSGFKSGVPVYFDNATDQSVSIRTNDKNIGELGAMHFAKHRVSGNSEIEILLDGSVIETVHIPTAFWPWKKCLYNINGKNIYSLEKQEYRKY